MAKYYAVKKGRKTGVFSTPFALENFQVPRYYLSTAYPIAAARRHAGTRLISLSHNPVLAGCPRGPPPFYTQKPPRLFFATRRFIFIF